MTNIPLYLFILVPVAAGIAVLFVPGKARYIKETISLLAAVLLFVFLTALKGQEVHSALTWLSPGIEFSLRLYHFNAFIILATSFFGLLTILYSSVFMAGKDRSNQFYSYLLISIGFANGAVLADNLIVLLFFWEGLLVTLFGMIAIGNKNAFKTATKALIIVGISDLIMMAGIALSAHLGGTFEISKMKLTVDGLGGVAFILLITGAVAKAGSMPFHTWIPDAAVDAPLPFMAFVPAALEKLIGIYLLTRISLDIFTLTPHSWASTVLMAIGSITLFLAVMMALVQKDYKRLLSYHAISQLGYMVLGIGTFTPVGIVGGIFHMINNALYKSGLFLTGGAVERQAGTTDLDKLGGLGRQMPVTFACFIITALSISGVPPFNGFFSKELIYDGALECGRIFYIAAIAGSFLTAASFLKLGHAAFLGKGREPGMSKVKEAPVLMLIPMAVIAAVCVIFGVWNSFPINGLIVPILGEARAHGHIFSGFPANATLVLITVAVLVAALVNHIYGVRRTGRGAGAVDHIHHAPGLRYIYDKAERGYLDPYNIWSRAVKVFSAAAMLFDRTIDLIYDRLVVGAASFSSSAIRGLHNGNYKTYMLWSMITAAILIAIIAGVI
ncbi:MAG: proton-conducting transporter membrane subunit [Candidatus Omnitrophota bacterium]